MSPQIIIALVAIATAVWALVEAFKQCRSTGLQGRWLLKSSWLFISLIIWVLYILENLGYIGDAGGALGLAGVLTWNAAHVSSALVSRLDRHNGRG